MWRNWNPLNPPVNNVSSEDEEQNHYQSADEHDLNNLVSPNRPHQSPSASPRALLRPDPPPVPEVLANVNQRLRNLPSREERAERRNAHRQAAQAAEEAAEAARAAAANMPNPPPVVVNFDAEDKEDAADAAVQARHIKVEFDPADVRFWFAQLEDEMTMAGVGRQWLKKTVLQRNLPVKQKEDVKSYFTLQKDQAGDHIYLDIKNELIRIYAAKPCDSYRKALSRTMVGLPSQLGYQIVDDICKKPQKLVGCCCSAAALALWTDKLPVNVREHISNEDFTADTYKSVFNAADKVFMSGRPSQVAAINLDETQAAFNPHNQPSAEVAAISGKNNNRGGGNRGSGRGGRGGRNNRGNRGGRGGNSNGSGSSNRGSRHASVPDSLADKLCSRHYTHADQAWYCLAPTTCPWKNKCVSRPEQ